MKKIIIIILSIVTISTIVIIAKNMYEKRKIINTGSAVFNELANDEIANNENNIDEKVGSLIQIYDIEDGYLNVEYNKDATKNSYNWDNISKNSKGFLKYEDETYISKLGVDVSSYQGNIDWNKVKEEGIEFAILRLGYRGYGKSGKILLDDKFEDNYKSATEQGIKIGVYFFSQAINEEEIKQEADFVIRNLEGKKIEYPVFYDLEKIKNDTARTDSLSNEQINSFTHIFCDEIKNKGYIPGVYGNAKTYTTKMKLEEFNNHIKWYADYQEKPLYPYEFYMWQYTESGRVNGIKTNVDLNIQFVNKSIEK